MGASESELELTLEEEELLAIQMDEAFNPDPKEIEEITKKVHSERQSQKDRGTMRELISVGNS